MRESKFVFGINGSWSVGMAASDVALGVRSGGALKKVLLLLPCVYK